MQPFAAFVYDEERRVQANAKGENYWYEYIREIVERVGITAVPIGWDSFQDQLQHLRVLFVGTDPPEDAAYAKDIEEWVSRGGILIGFRSIGLESVFGIRQKGMLNQPDGDFAISAQFEMLNDDVTLGIHSPIHPRQKLLIFSDVHLVELQGAVEVARLYDAAAADTGCPAITKRRIGEGTAFYFAFDVPKTLWVLHQGRPITEDFNADGHFRTNDMIVIGENEPEVLYADEIVFLLQNMVGRAPLPLIHHLPPDGDEIPDAAFYWGGDAEGLSGEEVVDVSNWMRERGLPYHVNILYRNGDFDLTNEQAETLLKNRHELSLHYNMKEGYEQPFPFTIQHMKPQAEAFKRKFKRDFACTVFHWCTWTGWVDPARWMFQLGGKADNSRINRAYPFLNPYNSVGFSFGTSFPYWYYDDYRHGNARIPFLQEPITAYEAGYTRDDQPRTDYELIHKIVDIAAYYHLTMNMFYHPVHIIRRPVCKEAIDGLLHYVREKKIAACHMANDALYEWWRCRSESRIGNLQTRGDRISFDVDSANDAGLIVKLPVQRTLAKRAMSGSVPLPCKNRHEFGENWLYIVCGPGEASVEIELEERT